MPVYIWKTSEMPCAICGLPVHILDDDIHYYDGDDPGNFEVVHGYCHAHETTPWDDEEPEYYEDDPFGYGGLGPIDGEDLP